MIKIEFKQIDNANKKKREKFAEIKRFFDNHKCKEGKILVLYGLRRTGKTTLIEQLLDNYDNTSALYYQVTKNDTTDDINRAIIEAKQKGIKLICFDEITKASDFIDNSAILSDIFAKQGVNIIVSGTDSLGFAFAEESELYDRMIKIRTTHIPFAEHCKVLDQKDIDDYIQYGGLMKKGEPEDRIVNDYESACKHLDSAVADNIAHSLASSDKHSALSKLSEEELRLLIKKIVERYSGKFDSKNIQKQINKVSVNLPVKKLPEIDIDEKVLDNLVLEKENIKNDFLEVLNISGKFHTEITDDIVQEAIRYLFDMDLLSVTPKTTFIFNENLGWRESEHTHEYYIVQPAIKYHFLSEGKNFIETKSYYNDLTFAQKEFMKAKLDEQIKGLMIEQIVIFDVQKDLVNTPYKVCKTVFKNGTDSLGEYDMLIYDINKNSYWAFEIKHTTEPYFKQEKHLTNTVLQNVIDNKYGHRKDVAVLYRGNPFKSETGIYYFNITDFLTAVHNYKNLDLVFDVLAKDICEKRIYSDEITDMKKEPENEVSQNHYYTLEDAFNDKQPSELTKNITKAYSKEYDER